MNLSEKLIYLRKQKGLIQKQVSDDLKISRQTLSKWENGAVIPTEANLKRLAEYYGVDEAYLKEEEFLQKDSIKKKKIPLWLIQILVVVSILMMIVVGFRKYPTLDIEVRTFDGFGEFYNVEVIKENEEYIWIRCNYNITQHQDEISTLMVDCFEEEITQETPISSTRKEEYKIPKDRINERYPYLMLRFSIFDEDGWVTQSALIIINASEYVLENHELKG